MVFHSPIAEVESFLFNNARIDEPFIYISKLSLPIYTKNIDYNNLTFTVSRSHIDCETESIIKKYNARKMLSGSALKIMYVAEGLADAYPRFSPTMIWDIAAGQIILEEAGGSLFSAKTKEPMIYNITNLKNDYFIMKRN